MRKLLAQLSIDSYAGITLESIRYLPLIRKTNLGRTEISHLQAPRLIINDL